MAARRDFGIVRLAILQDPRVQRASALYIKKRLAAPASAMGAVAGHVALLGGYLLLSTDDGVIRGDPALALVQAALVPNARDAGACIEALVEADLLERVDGHLRLRGFSDCYEPLLRKRRSDAEAKAARRRGDVAPTSPRRRGGLDLTRPDSTRPKDKAAPEAPPSPAPAPEDPVNAADVFSADPVPTSAVLHAELAAIDLDGRGGVGRRRWTATAEQLHRAGVSVAAIVGALKAAPPTAAPWEAWREWLGGKPKGAAAVANGSPTIPGKYAALSRPVRAETTTEATL